MTPATTGTVNEAVERTVVARTLKKLAERIRVFSLDVVVLIARKMSRLAELFELNFGHGCVVVSDLAIPFSHKYFRGARVGIVDDFVNFCTNVQRADQMVRACGADKIRLMAAGYRREMLLPQETAETDFGEALSDESYSEIVDSLPQELHRLAKPYDVEFPIIKCRLNSPFSAASDVMNWLRHRYGEDVVHELTPGDGVHGARVTLDFAGENDNVISKFRFYFSVGERHINLVPIFIPTCPSDHEPIELEFPSKKKAKNAAR